MSTLPLANGQAPASATSVSRGALWSGRILSAIPVLFLLLDGVGKLVQPTPAPVVDAMKQLGYAPQLAPALGVLLLFCVAVYLIPRTAAIGAVLLTGYLGGAVASHVRVGGPVFSLVFPVIVGAMLWGGLFLQDSRLRALLLGKVENRTR